MGIFSSSSCVSSYTRSQTGRAAYVQDADIKLPSRPGEKFYGVTIGEGINSVVFLTNESTFFYDPHNMSKLIEISGLINRLNLLIPPLKLNKIIVPGEIVPEHGRFIWADMTINIYSRTFKTPHYMHVTAHEIGHRVYEILAKNSLEWQKFYALSLDKNNFDIVDDEKFLVNAEDIEWGHPFDDASELFASAFAAYTVHTDEFIARINNKKNTAESRLLGKMMCCYIRDKIFKGKVFCASDPFRNDTSDALMKGMGEDRICDALKSCLGRGMEQDYGPNFTTKAAEIIAALSGSDERYLKLAIRCLLDSTYNMQMLSALDNTDNIDERFIPVMLELLRKPQLICSRVSGEDRVIDILVKIKSDKTIPGIIAVLDGGGKSRSIMLSKIRELQIKDPRIVRKLRNMLKSATSENDRKSIASCLDHLGLDPAGKK